MDRKNIFTNICLSLVTFILCILAMEVGLRAYEYFHGEFECDHNFFSIHTRINDSILAYGLKPQTNSRYECADNIINVQGIRVPDPQTVYRKKDKFRIVAIGDSVTYGFGREYNETYPYYIENQLNKMGYGVEVINLGVSAYNFKDYVEVLKSRLGELDPDLVVIGFVYPDQYVGNPNAKVWFKDNSEKCTLPYIGWKMGCESIHSLNNFRTLVFFKTRLEKIFSKQNTLNPEQDPFQRMRIDETREDYPLFLNEINELKQTFNPKKTVVVIFPYARKWDSYTLSEDNKNLMDIFSRQNISSIDLYEYMHNKHGVNERDIIDGEDTVHLNPNGYRIAANAIVEFITQKNLLENNGQ